MTKSPSNKSHNRLKNWAIPGGLLLAIAVGLLMFLCDCTSAACWTAAVTVLCAAWWTTEAIPLAATAMVPLAVFPMVGILTHQQAAAAYGDSLILLMLAGSMIATALEKCDGHRQIALRMVHLIGGGSCRRIILSFLITSAVLSMWLSNTATVVLLLPIALALIQASQEKSLAVPLLLSITYGASVGGTATPVGTPPNLIMIRLYSESAGHAIGFAEWMKIGLPIMVFMLPLAWLWLSRGVKGSAQLLLPPMTPWTTAQKRTLCIFGCTAIAWLTRTEPFGGWGEWLHIEKYAGDSTVALLAVVIMFICPSGDKENSYLLDWKSAESIPWGVFIMIGGGLAIGSAFEQSKLNESLGESLSFVGNWPIFGLMFAVCLASTCITEITSNTAVANVLLPICIGIASAAHIDPALLLFPATFGLNWSFMLPVGTAPNAIIYGTGLVSTPVMMREGFVLNLLGSCIISVVCLVVLVVAGGIR
jgi:solute carrier family 13 (sodium-dependent dicarboxylate transporter), member 2/3/5